MNAKRQVTIGRSRGASSRRRSGASSEHRSHDIDALASTLPYCDIVVTDKAIEDHANRTGLAERFGTVVLSRLADLLTQI